MNTAELLIKESKKFKQRETQLKLIYKNLEFALWKITPNNKLKRHGLPMKRRWLNGRKKY